MTSTLRKVGLKLPARIVFGAAIVIAACQNANADSFTPFIIRGTPTISTLSPAGTYEFVIAASGQKAALGSNAVNGMTLGDISSVKITRLDNRARFSSGSGPYTAPYLNIWITDGSGHFAVVANEPSDPDFQPLYANGYNLSFADLSDKAAKIYENTDTSWLPKQGSGLHFIDLASFVIQAPTAAQLSTSWAGLGTGAPRTLGTNDAYGVNWVFGDSLSNYVSGAPGYLVKDAGVSAVPEPGSVALLLTVLGTLGVMTRRRRCA